MTACSHALGIKIPRTFGINLGICQKCSSDESVVIILHFFLVSFSSYLTFPFCLLTISLFFSFLPLSVFFLYLSFFFSCLSLSSLFIKCRQCWYLQIILMPINLFYLLKVILKYLKITFIDDRVVNNYQKKLVSCWE